LKIILNPEKNLKIFSTDLEMCAKKSNFPNVRFGATNINYLGFRLTPNGVLPESDKLKAVRDSKSPSTVEEI
jgi:hypothetical protein